MYGNGIYIYLHLLDVCGKLVGQYTSPMDPQCFFWGVAHPQALIKASSWKAPKKAEHR